MRLSYRIILSILFFLLAVAVSSYGSVRYELKRATPVRLVELSHDIMMGEVGKVETGNNRGIADKYNRAVGVPLGSPYCQAGQYWSYLTALERSRCNALLPIPRNGMANATFDYIRKNGVKTAYIPQIHDFIVWKSPKNYTGHIERIISVGKAGWVKTVGFNTTSGNTGNQRDGGGVWIRNRNIKHPLGSRPIRGLAGVRI